MCIVFFFFGIIIGSFLNVCIYRIPREKKIVYDYSSCTNCERYIDLKYLIPILSYIFLKGRCRYCKGKISLRYPFIEILTGVLYLLIYKYYGFSILTFKYLFLISCLIVISVIDYDTKEVYAITTYTSIIVGVVFSFIEKFYLGERISNYLLGGLVSIFFIFLISKLTGAMGSGDIEIHAIGGVFLGWQLALINLFLSFIIGGIIAFLAIIFKGKKREDYIAFGPAIGISTTILIFFGDLIKNIYFPF